jgi:hypothetical protein
MNTEEVQAILATLPEARVTEEAMKKRIASVRYLRDELTTICVITLDNGFKVIGHSTPAKAGNFNAEVGEHYAYDNAFRQLWQFFGFLLVEQSFTQ